jgi:hypothetical protein
VFRNRPVSLVLIGLFVWVTACTSYKQIELAEVTDHGKVRVTFADGERTTLREANVIGDSISGLVREGRPRPEDVERSFATDQVTYVEAKGTNVVGTVFLTFGIAVVLAAAIGYGAISSNHSWP